jgi:hypothetical protein
MDKKPTSEMPHSSLLQIVLGEIDPFTHFKVLTCFHGLPEADLAKLKPAKTTFPTLTCKDNLQEAYIILLAMPSSWSYVGVSKGNKENVVVGMANLLIMDDDSRKLTGGLNNPNSE